MKKILLIIFLIIFTFSLSGCLATNPTKIDSSDFENATSLLEEQYELTLPNSATLISGYFDHAFRDPSIILAFTIESYELESMFSDEWVESGRIDGPFIMEEMLPLEAFSPKGQYNFEGELYTHLWYVESQNGFYTCVFSGRHPNEHF